MKKFKIISTCASLILMIAMLAFGVYAASTKVSFSVTGTVSFKCENVFIKVAGSIVENNATLPPSTQEYYYSKPTGDQKNVTELATKGLGAGEFIDEDNAGKAKKILTYYVEVVNLHSMDINLKLDYTWICESKYNSKTNTDVTKSAVKVDAYYQDKTGASYDTTKNYLTGATISHSGTEIVQDTIETNTTAVNFGANSSRLFVVTLTINDDALVYKLTPNSSLKLSIDASLKG